MFKCFLDVDSSAVSNHSVVNLKSDNEGTSSYAQTLKIKKTDEANDSKIVYFPVGTWD